MCQARVFVDDECVMQDVIWLEPDGDGFLLRTFFGEPVRVKGRLKGIDLLRHQILLTDDAGDKDNAE